MENGHVHTTRNHSYRTSSFLQTTSRQTNRQTNERVNELHAIHGVCVRCFREQRAMVEERKARRTRYRGATTMRAEIATVRRASQHQMVSRSDAYLHFQRGRRNYAREQRHRRQVKHTYLNFIVAFSRLLDNTGDDSLSY